MFSSKIFWVVSYIVSFICALIAFPVFLLSFYPYSVIAIILYIFLLALLTVLCRRKSTESTAKKRSLFFILLIPVITLILILISIEVGLIRFPG